MQKFCISNKWLENGGCKNSARPYFPLNSVLSLQQMKDAEILHLRGVAQNRWMQKFCTILLSAKFATFSTTNERCRNSASQTSGLRNGGCKNSARPYFPLNSVLSLQQMKDAEILHLRGVAQNRWMQKFCTILLSAKFTTISTTNERCRNSASQRSGLRKVDAKILHDLIFH